MPDAVPTELKWREMTKDVTASAALTKCSQLISKYHHAWETYTDERIGYLTEIVRTCATHLMIVESAAARAPFTMPGMAAAKQKSIINKAVRSWAIARKAVGSRKHAIQVLRHVDLDLRRRRIGEGAKLTHAILDDCWRDRNKLFPGDAGSRSRAP